MESRQNELEIQDTFQSIPASGETHSEIRLSPQSLQTNLYKATSRQHAAIRRPIGPYSMPHHTRQWRGKFDSGDSSSSSTLTCLADGAVAAMDMAHSASSLIPSGLSHLPKFHNSAPTSMVRLEASAATTEPLYIVRPSQYLPPRNV